MLALLPDKPPKYFPATSQAGTSVTVKLSKRDAATIENIARAAIRQLGLNQPHIERQGYDFVQKAAAFMRSRGEVRQAVDATKGANVTLQLSVPGWALAQLSLFAQSMGVQLRRPAGSADTHIASVVNPEVRAMQRQWGRVVTAALIHLSSCFIHDWRVRDEYRRKLILYSQQVIQAVDDGKLTAQEGMELASKLRNELMAAARLKTSTIGRVLAERIKPTPPTVVELQELYAQRLKFGQPFGELCQDKQKQVWTQIIKSAGRADAKTTRYAERLGHVGQGLLLMTTAITIWHIATANNKLAAVKYQGLPLLKALVDVYIKEAATFIVPLAAFVGAMLGALSPKSGGNNGD